MYTVVYICCGPVNQLYQHIQAPGHHVNYLNKYTSIMFQNPHLNDIACNCLCFFFTDQFDFVTHITDLHN